MIDLVNWQQEEPTGYGGGRQLSLDGTSRVTGDCHARFCERLCQEGAKASCCTKDEGRPFGVALWGEASNCRKLLRTKAAVVNVPVKRRGIGSRQVGMRETSANELLITHRNPSDDIETGERACSGIEHGRYLLTGHAVSGAKTA